MRRPAVAYCPYLECSGSVLLWPIKKKSMSSRPNISITKKSRDQLLPRLKTALETNHNTKYRRQERSYIKGP